MPEQYLIDPTGTLYRELPQGGLQAIPRGAEPSGARAAAEARARAGEQVAGPDPGQDDSDVGPGPDFDPLAPGAPPPPARNAEGQFPAEWSFTPSGPRLNPITGLPGSPGAGRAPAAAPQAEPGSGGPAFQLPLMTPWGVFFGSMGFGRKPSNLPPAAPPIAPAEGGHFDPSAFGVGQEPPAIEGPDTGLTAAELMERAGPRPTPPTATVDPSLALAQQQAAERETRLGALYDTFQQGIEGERRPKWLNALNIGLAPWSGPGGVAREVDRQAAQRESIRNALLQVGLAREGTSEETARAALAAMSGAHGVEQENMARTYAENVGARGERLGLESAADQRTFQAGVEAWREGAARGRQAHASREAVGLEELRIARAKRDAALAAAASGSGRTGIDAAMAAIAGTGHPEIEVGFGKQLARSGLANWIQQQALVRGGLRQALPQIHREFISAGYIPANTRVPRFSEGVTPAALAEYYSRLGVPVENFADWFPGLGQPAAAAGGR